ncbi:MAG TPA: hypothetical protein DDW76_27640 [Cyanobacteria bacterium UBA11369]|nr:hypothetical protein [Cyanobacteria bacterium UBA11371]HBE18956.1 hypothetical protein [Cyanobacteria bacterium UBA11367]HBE30765.1 hypothetical protein [Cyanobacteria bacterium UBA11368]HBE52441.1 hypothetical protein [Cyanobacteria bacterium UBA11369]
MERRKELLNQLSQTEVGVDWGIIKSGYFRLLYGLPVALQIQLACFMMRRYLPIFEKREQYIRWPRIILDDVAQWVEENERCIPRCGRFEGPFDSAFRNGFDGLVAAYYYRDNQFVVTSACIYAFSSAINARGCNVWSADDPEAVEIWKKRSDNPEIYLEPKRKSYNNLAAIAVTKREWQEVAKWLWEKEVWNYLDEVNIEEMENYLDYWTANQKILIVPAFFEMVQQALIQRFAEREALTVEEIFSKYYTQRNLNHLDIIQIWQEITAVLQLDPQKVRPLDRFDTELAAIYLFPRRLADLDKYLADKCQGIIEFNDEIETIDDLILLVSANKKY